MIKVSLNYRERKPMLKKILSLIVPFVLIMTIYAQELSPFVFVSDDETPAIAHVARTRDNRDYAFAEQYTDPGAVIFHDGQFHMFRNGFVGWPATVWVHYMVSDDGVEWEQSSQDPVLLTEDVPFADIASLASSVIVEADGTWVLYFYTWNNSSGAFSDGEIGRATADNLQGPWIVDDEPILTMGDAGDFDEQGVSSPHVIQTDEGYIMYYDGIASDNGRSVGIATSADGINWEKVGDNPILAPVADWEGAFLHQARVIALDAGYMMVYRGATAQSGGMRLGVATSEDGYTWQRADDFILSPDMLEHHTAIWFTSTAYREDELYLFIELMPSSNVTDIFTMKAAIADLVTLVEE